jgi:hypothetical protein
MPSIVDDERRRMRPQAALPLLNDTWHRHRRGALQLAPRRPERGPSEYSDRLLAGDLPELPLRQVVLLV